MSATVEQRAAELARQYELAPDAGERLARLAADSVELEISGTAVRTADDAIDRHVADSLAGLAVEELASAERIADIGSGVGFPGLVLALARPNSRVVLVESVRKKAEVAARLARDHEIENVESIWARVEEVSAVGSEHREAYDVVTARALADLNVLIEYALPLLRPGGTLVAWKGQPTPDELANAAASAEQLGFETPRLQHYTPFARSNRCFAIARRVGELSERHPRRPGTALKRPITS